MTYKYSEDFKKRVMAAIPRSSLAVKDMLDEGSDHIGRIFSDNMVYVEPQKVFDCINENKIDVLKSYAERLIEIERLYDEWYNTYKTHKNCKKKE